MCWRNTPSSREAEAPRRGLGARVGVVALPLQPAVPEHLEGVARQQEDRLGRLRRALQRAAEPDVADLDHAVRGLDAQEADDAGRRPGRAVDDRVEVRIGRRRLGSGAPRTLRDRRRTARRAGRCPEPRVGALAVRRRRTSASPWRAAHRAARAPTRVARRSGWHPATRAGGVEAGGGRRFTRWPRSWTRGGSSPAATRDVGPLGPALAQEALELPRDHVAGGQLGRVALGLLLGGSLLQPLDEGLDVGVALDRQRHLALVVGRRPARAPRRRRSRRPATPACAPARAPPSGSAPRRRSAGRSPTATRSGCRPPGRRRAGRRRCPVGPS